MFFWRPLFLNASMLYSDSWTEFVRMLDLLAVSVAKYTLLMVKFTFSTQILGVNHEQSTAQIVQEN